MTQATNTTTVTTTNMVEGKGKTIAMFALDSQNILATPVAQDLIAPHLNDEYFLATPAAKAAMTRAAAKKAGLVIVHCPAEQARKINKDARAKVRAMLKTMEAAQQVAAEGEVKTTA